MNDIIIAKGISYREFLEPFRTKKKIRFSKFKQAVLDSNYNLKKILNFVAGGANIDASDNHKRNSILHKCSSLEVIRELLLAGANINAQNKFQETPLITAVIRDKGLLIVRELLIHGAQIDAKNFYGNTALNLAVRKKWPNSEVIKELLRYGACINEHNQFNRSKYLSNFRSPLEYCLNFKPGLDKLMIQDYIIKNFDAKTGKVQPKLNISKAPEGNHQMLKEHASKCFAEIRMMKKNILVGGLTIYDFVIEEYISNKTYKKMASKINLLEDYGIYKDFILSKILERQNFLEELNQVQVFCKLKTGKIYLDYLCTYNISEYLSNLDLMRLIVAFEFTKNDL